MTLAQFKKLFKLTRESFFPVVDEDFHLRGILASGDLREVIFEEDVLDLLVLGELVSPPVFVELEESLYDTLLVFLRTGYGQIPIINTETGLLGLLRMEDLMEAYHREISTLKEN